MVGVDILQKAEPYYPPGYTGYCPQHLFKCGKTFGDLSHQLLLDPEVSHAKKLALVDRTKQHEVTKPTKTDLAVVNARSNRTDAIYGHPTLSSYDGHVPNLGDVRDKPFEIQAIKGIADFERKHLQRKASRNQFKKVIELQSGDRLPETLEDRLLLQSKFKLPLIAVRPERVGLQKSHPVDEKYLKPRDYSTSPYFMENLNPQKYFINGFTGYIPYRHNHFGKVSKLMTTDGLRDFTSGYLYRKRTEWAPVKIDSRKPKAISSATNSLIYLKDTPLMPTYTGHVPGAKFKVGKTYGSNSKQAHHYIEEHLFNLKLSKCEMPL